MIHDEFGRIVPALQPVERVFDDASLAADVPSGETAAVSPSPGLVVEPAAAVPLSAVPAESSAVPASNVFEPVDGEEQTDSLPMTAVPVGPSPASVESGEEFPRHRSQICHAPRSLQWSSVTTTLASAPPWCVHCSVSLQM